MYCPDWIFDISVSRVSSEYLESNCPLESFAKKYSSGLSKKYEEITFIELLEPAEEILRFLNEAKASDKAVELLSGYIYYRVYYVNLKKKRNLQPFFGSLESATKKKIYSPEKSLKSFRAYVFGKKSKTVPDRPLGWSIENEKSLENFLEIINQKINFSGVFKEN